MYNEDMEYKDRRKNLFSSGLLDTYILNILYSHSCNTYIVLKTLCKTLNLPFCASNIYNCVHRLESEKLIQGTVVIKKAKYSKTYSLTYKGEQTLFANIQELQHLVTH